MYQFPRFKKAKNIFHGIYLSKPKLKNFTTIKVNQVHSSRINIIKSIKSTKPITPPADGLITNQPKIVLLIKTADCIPLFLYNPKTRVIGLIHVGWRGAIGKIHIKAIKIMKTKFNSQPRDIIAALGPAICKKCYLFAQKPIQSDKPEWKEYITKTNANYHIDLKGFVKKSLLDLGLKSENIYTLNKCTSQNSNLPSHYNSKSGRLYSLLALKS